jgi:alpha-L-rhamnosidase
MVIKHQGPALVAIVIAVAVFPARRTASADAPPASLEVVDLRCEYLRDPLGLDVREPRLSWKLAAVDPAARGLRQTAFRLLVASTPEALAADSGDLLESTAEDDRVVVAYAGKALRSGMTCHWKVKARDGDGAWSAWSKPARWTVGPLDPSDWKARWIGAGETFTREKGWPPPDNKVPDPWLRKTFRLDAAPARAAIHVASIGYHELYVNGEKADDAILVPSVTDGTKRARWRTYEIAGKLRAGENVLGLWLGVSWSIFPPHKRDDRPQCPMAIAQAEIELPGGKTVLVATDETWKTHPSPNRLLGVWDFMHFGGELYDARMEVPGWCAPGLDEVDWKPVALFGPKLALSADRVEPNRLQKAIAPVSIAEKGAGIHRIDMGVNFAGWIEADVEGKPGDRIDFIFSERPEREMTHNLHSASIIGPSGKGTFRNRFNYGVGRWITVKGLAAAPRPEAIRGHLVRTDYGRAGTFECSSELLNRICATTLWTFENLSLGGYVVDCPQRERMGYGGDAHATTGTGLNFYDLGAFYSKWAEDWRDVQGKDGNLPYTAPTYWGGGGPGWSGFCITLPWMVHRRYGDLRILEEGFPTMERWLAFLATKAKGDLLARWGGEWDFLGDWLWPGATGVNGDTRETLFFNNCYWVYNLLTAARVADVLRKAERAATWRRRAGEVRAAIHREFYKPDEKSYVNGFPAYLAIALLAGVPPEAERAGVWKRLEEEILVRRKGHIHAGITGGAFLFLALLEAGRNDLIASMALQESYPGWGDQIAKGATTFWEDWEGRQSLLHSSYLFIGPWFLEGLAGIRPDPDVPGFGKFIIEPDVGAAKAVTWAKGTYESPRGSIESSWKVDGGRLELRVAVPPNATATVRLPSKNPASIREGKRPLAEAKGVERVAVEGGRAVLRVGSGRYEFEAEAP